MDYNITNGRDAAARAQAEELLKSLSANTENAENTTDTTAAGAADAETTPTDDATPPSAAPPAAWSAGMVPSSVDFDQDAFTEGIHVPVTSDPSAWRTAPADVQPDEDAAVEPAATVAQPDAPAAPASTPQPAAPTGYPEVPGYNTQQGYGDQGYSDQQPPARPAVPTTPPVAYPQPLQPGYPQQQPDGRHSYGPPAPAAYPHQQQPGGYQPAFDTSGYQQPPNSGYQQPAPQQPAYGQTSYPGAYSQPGYPQQQPTQWGGPGAGGQPVGYPQPPAPHITPAPDLDTDDATTGPLGAIDETPVSGWRSTARRIGLRVKQSPDEQLWHTMVRAINRPLRDPRVIGVTAPKGGVAKTTVLSMMSVVVARLRPNCRIVAVDTDHNGGLVLRADGRQPSDILAFARAVERGNADRPNFMAHTVDGVDILGSSPSLVDPPITPEMWQTVLDELKRRYDLIFVDMSIMQATETYAAVLQSLDALVVVATPTIEATRPLGEIPQWLDLNKASHLKARRTTVFTKIDTEPDEVDVPKLIKREHDAGIEAAAVPFDPHLRTAANLTFDEVATATKKAFVTVAASAIKSVS